MLFRPAELHPEPCVVADDDMLDYWLPVVWWALRQPHRSVVLCGCHFWKWQQGDSGSYLPPLWTIRWKDTGKEETVRLWDNAALPAYLRPSFPDNVEVIRARFHSPQTIAATFQGQRL